MNYTQIQKEFIKKVKNENDLILRGQDVQFLVSPKSEFDEHSVTVYLKVFNEEFSTGYFNKSTTSDELINDFYSRLHDYSTDNAGDHIIGLKALQLENRFKDVIAEIKTFLVFSNRNLSPEEIQIDIEYDYLKNIKNGFPNYWMEIRIKNNLIIKRNFEFDDFTHLLNKELKEKLDDVKEKWA